MKHITLRILVDEKDVVAIRTTSDATTNEDLDADILTLVQATASDRRLEADLHFRRSGLSNDEFLAQFGEVYGL